MEEKQTADKTRLALRRRQAGRWVLRAAGTVAVLSVLGIAGYRMFFSGASGEQAQERQPAANTALAAYGTIEKTVFGSGEIMPASQPAVYSDVDARVAESYYELGDTVKAGDILMLLENEELETQIEQLEYDLQLAQEEVTATQTHEQYVYRQLYDDEGDPRFDVNTGEPLMGKYSNEITIRAPASGRVMAIYIEAGDDSLAVYRDKGAVMVLSTDGRMKVNLSGLEGQSLELGDTVRVLGDGVDTEGTLISLTRRGTEATVQVIGDEYEMDTPVTVYTEAGDLLGEGILEINKPMAVSSYGGTVKGITVEVGDQVSRYDVLARIVWDEIPLYLDNASVLNEYNKARVELENAVADRAALTIVAPCDGLIASVDVEEGSDVTAGTQLLSIVEDAGMTLTLSVDELDILSVEPGQEVHLSVDALPDAQLTGVVQKIAPLGNTDTSVTTYDVYIELTSEDERIKGGMNVSGEIVVDSAQDALLIPTDALQKGEDGYCVTLADGQIRDVETGIMTDEQVQILSGLTAGETVVYSIPMA